MAPARPFWDDDALMAKMRTKQRATIGLLGKAITRRSGGRCELCEGRVELRVYELAPFPESPSVDRTLMACGRCREWLETGDVVAVEAHFLGAAVWAEEPAVRLAAARMLLSSDAPQDLWLRDALENTGVDPATGEYRDDALLS